MGTAYFVLKNTALTFMIVSFLQLEVDSKSLEIHLMDVVRKNLAPKFLGHEPISIDSNKNFTQDQIESIKIKIKDSEFYKEAKSSMRETIMREVQSFFKENKNDNEASN